MTADKSTITLASYDPLKPDEERWTVISVDGKTPSESDIKSFRKEQRKQSDSPQPDEESYKVEKETADVLVVSFKYNTTTIPKDVAFLKDCRTYLTVNLKTKTLEHSQVLIAFDEKSAFFWNRFGKYKTPLCSSF